MILNTGEKLTSIPNKIRTMHQRLDAPEVSELENGQQNLAQSSQNYEIRQLIQRLRSKLSLLRNAIQKQNFYAHCIKLVTLFVIAIAHLIYMHPFLDMMSVLEDYSAQIDSKLLMDFRLGPSALKQLVNLPFCSDLILKSIFPVALLKYLLILCVMTLAYMFVAWLIEYCIKHWFPPHSCCSCAADNCCDGFGKIPENFCNTDCQTAWNTNNNISFSHRQQLIQEKSYLPGFIIPFKGSNEKPTYLNNSDSFIFPQQKMTPLRIPNPLVSLVDEEPTIEQIIPIEEPIPAEPKPPNFANVI